MTSEVMDRGCPFSDTASAAITAKEATKMKKNVFSKWFVVLCLFSTLVWWASGGIREVSAMAQDKSAPASDSTDVDAIKQIGQDMGNAMVAGDIDKLNQIYADDWATVTSSGKVVTKENLLTDFKSFHDKLEWFENGPIDVQVHGDVAVANGTVKERRIRDGKDTSGEFVYVDLLRKRAGKWVVVRSASARLK
jgi:ketosteroid isomerase-like protein